MEGEGGGEGSGGRGGGRVVVANGNCHLHNGDDVLEGPLKWEA